MALNGENNFAGSIEEIQLKFSPEDVNHPDVNHPDVNHPEPVCSTVKIPNINHQQQYSTSFGSYDSGTLSRKVLVHQSPYHYSPQPEKKRKIMRVINYCTLH